VTAENADHHVIKWFMDMIINNKHTGSEL